jgi:pimeloyl-ACP methyl ester carboxylesterase
MATTPIKLNRRTWGKGPPLIILHGLFGSTINWEPIGQTLARHWTVIALDLRNHGDSPHSPDFGYDALIADLNQFFKELNIEKAHLLGHSLGGKVAMAFTDRFPQRIDRLIVVDIAPKPYPAGHRHMLKALIDIDLYPIGSLREAVENLKPMIPSMAIRQFLVKNLVRGKDGRYRWKINLPAIYNHYDALSKGPRLTNVFPNPALFLRGAVSEFIIDEDRALIERFFVDYRLLTIAGAGHWLHVDDPERTSQAISEFLSSD